MVYFQDVMVYSMVEDKDNPTDTDYFYLNPNTGVVTLRKVWDRGEKKEFRVIMKENKRVLINL